MGGHYLALTTTNPGPPPHPTLTRGCQEGAPRQSPAQGRKCQDPPRGHCCHMWPVLSPGVSGDSCAPPSLHNNPPSQAGAAPQPGNSRLEFASTAPDKPRRLSSVPAGEGGPGLIIQEWGPARTPLSPGAPTPGPGEAPCGSSNPRHPVATAHPPPEKQTLWRCAAGPVPRRHHQLAPNCPLHQWGWHCWQHALPAPVAALDLAKPGACSHGGGFLKLSWLGSCWKSCA